MHVGDKGGYLLLKVMKLLFESIHALGRVIVRAESVVFVFVVGVIIIRACVLLDSIALPSCLRIFEVSGRRSGGGAGGRRRSELHRDHLSHLSFGDFDTVRQLGCLGGVYAVSAVPIATKEGHRLWSSESHGFYQAHLRA